MATAETILLAMASVILLGFLGQIFFRATRISDILLLIGFGILLGTVLNPFDTTAFPVLAPIVGMFALLIILFEGGLDLRIHDLLHGLGRGGILALFGFLLTATFVAVAAHVIFQFEWLIGLLLGCILGGSSSIAVIPVIKRLPVQEKTRVILSLESALTDVFCVIGALTVASILALRATPDVTHIGQTILSDFIVAAAFGLGAGLVWLKFLDSGIGKGVNYMLTVAVILGLHVAVTTLDANGPVSVLVFGIVLGNTRSLHSILRLQTEGFSHILRAFQSETAFVVRAFFFVYLGLILDLPSITWPVLGVGIVLLIAIAAARALAVYLASWRGADIANDRGVWWAMMPRGLAAAVLASVPSLGPGFPGTQNFVAYSAIVIILTNIVASFAGFLQPKQRDDQEEEQEFELTEPTPRARRRSTRTPADRSATP